MPPIIEVVLLAPYNIYITCLNISFISSLTTNHWFVVIRILCYLHETINMILFLDKSGSSFLVHFQMPIG